MDIYQCMTCGWQQPHGGMLVNLEAQEKHVAEKLAEEGVQHVVWVGEINALEKLFGQTSGLVEDYDVTAMPGKVESW